jgi:hypothetical protein
MARIDPSVLVVYTVPLYGQSLCVRQDTLNSGVGVRHRRRGDNMIDRASKKAAPYCKAD